MKINKKTIVGLLGGGLATVAATLGGIELDKKIKHDNKFREFEKISNLFNSKAYEYMKDKEIYLPKWQDIARWERSHKLKHTADGYQTERKKFLEKYPTPIDFRDYCYEFFRTKMEWCSASREECSDCTRKSSWDK